MLNHSNSPRCPGLTDATTLLAFSAKRRFALLHSAIACIALFPCWLFGADAPVKGPPATSGFYYYQDVNPDVPWSINIVRVERNRPEFSFHTTLGQSNVFGLGIVSDQVKYSSHECGQPLAAINGDFWEKKEEYLGRPRNLQIEDGELLASPSGNAAFWIDCDGNPAISNVTSQFFITWPDGKTNALGLNGERKDDEIVLYTSHVGQSTHTAGGMEFILESKPGFPWLPLHVGSNYTAIVRETRTSGGTPIKPAGMVLSIGPKLMELARPLKPGDEVRFSIQTFPALTGARVAIGGGPTLIENGKPEHWSGLVHMRHPRTAIGFNDKYIFMVEVDGRQRDLSVGMTLPELATYMVKLGCQKAMNFDGGGSSTLWALGNVMNSPSEGRERPAANALILMRKPAGSK